MDSPLGKGNIYEKLCLKLVRKSTRLLSQTSRLLFSFFIPFSSFNVNCCWGRKDDDSSSVKFESAFDMSCQEIIIEMRKEKRN